MPANIGTPIVATIPEGTWCGMGDSDDAEGNFVLYYLARSDPSTFFVAIEDGKAVEIGQRTHESIHGESTLHSQPSGFTKVARNDAGRSTMTSLSHEGSVVNTTTIARGFSDGYVVRFATDPSGGTAVLRTYQDSNKVFQTVYRRFGQMGAPESGEVNLGANRLARAVAVNLAGHVLVVASDTTASRPPLVMRWLARDGNPLTGWSAIPPDPNNDLLVESAQFLADGSLLARFWDSATVQFEDLASGPSALPAWLAERRDDRLALIRGGRGYASWGPKSKCGSSLEILTAQGVSCGCVDVPGLTPFATIQSHASIGRDGSLIVPRELQQARCTTYDLYPHLLR